MIDLRVLRCKKFDVQVQLVNFRLAVIVLQSVFRVYLLCICRLIFYKFNLFDNLQHEGSLHETKTNAKQKIAVNVLLINSPDN